MSSTIEIVCTDDGKFMVSVTSGSDDDSGAAEQMASPDAGAAPASAPAAGTPAPAMDQGDEGDDSGAQTADNIDDALALAKQMYESQASGDDQGADDAANGSEPMNPDDAKAYWGQLAAKKAKAKPAMHGM